MSDLKPCPFCGKPATSHEPDRYAANYAVGCSLCGIHFLSRTESVAAEAWNRRAPSPLRDKLRGLVEAEREKRDVGAWDALNAEGLLDRLAALIDEDEKP